MNKIVGLKRREGDFKTKDDQKIHFIYIDLYYKVLDPIKDSVGEIIEKVSIKEEFLNDWMKVKNLDLTKMIGYQFNEVYFDKYQKARGFI